MPRQIGQAALGGAQSAVARHDFGAPLLTKQSQADEVRSPWGAVFEADRESIDAALSNEFIALALDTPGLRRLTFRP